MTLTSPGCPVAGSLPGDVERRVRQVPGVSDVRVHLTWEPAWSIDLMSEEAKLELGFRQIDGVPPQPVATATDEQHTEHEL